MRLSIVIAILDSHEAFKRQNRYFKKMDLPDDIEFVFVDDGSEVPLEIMGLKNSKIIYTNDKRPWTQGIARNIGVKNAEGEYVLCTDIDHILSKEAIMASYAMTEDMMIFPRYLAVLTEEGELTQDPEIMKDYGLDLERLHTKRGLYASFHGNTYCIKRQLFLDLGGNDERYCLYGHHAPNRHGEDAIFNRTFNHWSNANGGTSTVGPKIYCFTNGRYNINGDSNPKGLFHTLSYEQPK